MEYHRSQYRKSYQENNQSDRELEGKSLPFRSAGTMKMYCCGYISVCEFTGEVPAEKESRSDCKQCSSVTGDRRIHSEIAARGC